MYNKQYLMKYMVRVPGLEPGRPNGRGILSETR